MSTNVTRIPVECPDCCAPLGMMVYVKGRIRLDVGGWLVTDGMCHCYRCGRPVHFKPPTSTWEQLVERYLTRESDSQPTNGAPRPHPHDDAAEGIRQCSSPAVSLA